MQNRSRAFDLLDILLSGKLNFVTIQLDENVTDVSYFEEEFEALIAYVPWRASRDKIIVIGDFWDKHYNEAHASCCKSRRALR